MLRRETTDWRFLGAGARLVILWRRPKDRFEFQAHTYGQDGVHKRCRAYDTMTGLVRDFLDEILQDSDVARVFQRAAQLLPGLRDAYRHVVAREQKASRQPAASLS